MMRCPGRLNRPEQRDLARHDSFQTGARRFVRPLAGRGRGQLPGSAAGSAGRRACRVRLRSHPRSERQITRIVSSPAIVPATLSRRTASRSARRGGSSDAQYKLELSTLTEVTSRELAPAGETNIGRFSVVGRTSIMVGHGDEQCPRRGTQARRSMCRARALPRVTSMPRSARDRRASWLPIDSECGRGSFHAWHSWCQNAVAGLICMIIHTYMHISAQAGRRSPTQHLTIAGPAEPRQSCQPTDQRRPSHGSHPRQRRPTRDGTPTQGQQRGL